MAAFAPDLIGIVEAFYARDLSEDQWLALVAQKLRPLIDRNGLGVASAIHECPDPCSLRPTHALLHDVSEKLQAIFFETFQVPFEPLYVAESFLGRSCYLSSDIKGWDEIPSVRSGAMRAAGGLDVLQVNVMDPDGDGCWFGSPQSARAPIADDAYLTLARLARHLTAARRLRRRHGRTPLVDKADAVLDPNGRTRHARGMARDASSRAALERAARSMDAARSRHPGKSSRGTLEEWQSLVGKRWTLVEHFESDGQRVVLAIENRPKPPSLELLSDRERLVVSLALLGRDNKVIAYELSLAQSTVRVLMARAATKVGARSRQELLEKVANVSGPDKRRVRYPLAH